MKCVNCGTELLGSMKKCPKCGYDSEKGTIDQSNVKQMHQSEEKRSEALTYNKLITCEGRFSNDGGKGIDCEVRLADDHVLIIAESKNADKGRRRTKAAFGLVGTLLYDAAHSGEQKVLYSIDLSEIRQVIQLGVGQNAYFPSGWKFSTANGESFLMVMDRKMQKELKLLLRERWK